MSGPDVMGGDGHYHMIDDERTSVDESGESHTHTHLGEVSGLQLSIEDKKSLEYKHAGGRVIECKEIDRNGVRVGQISGYIATWDVDRGRDRFHRGAFADSIKEHLDKSRQVRFKDHHRNTIGGFPIGTVVEDDVGLFGVGEVNLEVQQGAEAYALAKQGVLVDFSVGFAAVEAFDESGVRNITKAILIEGSIVDEPMNPNAKITSVKSNATANDVMSMDVRGVEQMLIESGTMSRKAAKALASRLAPQVAETKTLADIMGQLTDLKSMI